MTASYCNLRPKACALYQGSAIGPKPDSGLTLYLCSALAGVLLVVAVVASLPLGSIP